MAQLSGIMCGGRFTVIYVPAGQVPPPGQMMDSRLQSRGRNIMGLSRTDLNDIAQFLGINNLIWTSAQLQQQIQMAMIAAGLAN